MASEPDEDLMAGNETTNRLRASKSLSAYGQVILLRGSQRLLTPHVIDRFAGHET
jgi:hypothetical protein